MSTAMMHNTMVARKTPVSNNASASRALCSKNPPQAKMVLSSSLRGTASASFAGNTAVFRAQCSSKTQKAASKRIETTIMKSSEVARGYASALLELAQSENCLEDIHNDVDSLATAISDEFGDVLQDPTVTDEEKKELISKICSQVGFNTYTVNFLNLLVDKRRIGYVTEILAEFDTLYCDATNTQVATVISAVKLQTEQQFLIAKKLQALTGAKNIKVKPQIDESILGGFIVQYGVDNSSLLDFSVKGQLDEIAAAIDPATV